MEPLAQAVAFVVLTEKRELNALISRIQNNGEKMDENVHQAAVSCLYHAEQHGDVTLATRLIEAMPKSSRRQALIHWFEQFGPLVFDREKAAFHVSRAKVKAPYLVEKAKDVPFWEYTTERDPQPFSIDKFIAMIGRKLQKAKESGELDEAGLATIQTKVAALTL